MMEIPPPPAAPRRKLRIPLRVETLLQEDGVPRFFAYAGNVSHTGAFLQCACPREIGSVIPVRLHMREAPEGSIVCHVQVIWRRGYGGRHGPTPGMGVRFLGLEEKVERHLRAYCQR